MPTDTEILLTIKLQQQLFVDPKRIRLLKEIRQCGSINQAAKNAKVSYKSAWDHLAAMNAISPKPLLERNIGGKHGGGTVLTIYAKRFLQLYDLLEQTQQKAFAILQDESIPLDSILHATSHFSLQSSARNQFLGTISKLSYQNIHCFVEIQLKGINQPLAVSITEKSAIRLNLTLGKEVMLMIKAPWVNLYRHKPENRSVNLFLATVMDILDKGETKEIMLNFSEANLPCCATLTTKEQVKLQDQVWIYIDPEQVILTTL